MSPRALVTGLFGGLAAVALGGFLFAAGTAAELDAIHARLDSHEAALRALAGLFNLPPETVPPAP